MMIKPSTIRFLFYACWIISLLFQAVFTELLADEAYYWKYAQQLAWGYFDHPPVVAVLIKAGYALFQNELGVRLFFVACSTLTIVVWEHMLKPAKLTLFYTLVISVAMLHVVGFMATTDTPFLLLVSCFLLLYQRFLNNPNWKISVLLALNISLMLFTKYHGIIVVGLVLLSNLKLLKSGYFWFIVLLSTCFMLPHILWQIEADYPSFKYHLFERSNLPYNFNNTLEYLLTQPFMLGPIIGVLFFIIFYRFKPASLFEKGLKFCFWGGYAFFLVMSFRGRIEAYWTFFILVPAIYVSYQQLLTHEKFARLLNKQFPYAVVIVVLIKFFLVCDFLPNYDFTQQISRKFHHKKEEVISTHHIANNTPVAFMNSYQKASLYEFYSGMPSFSFNNVMGRKNQYNIWNTEDQFRGQKVMMVPNYHMPSFDTIPHVLSETNYLFIDDFQGYTSIKFIPINQFSKSSVLDTINIDLIVVNTSKTTLDFNANKQYPSYLYYQFFDGNTMVKEKELFRMQNNMIGDTLSVAIVMPPTPGTFDVYYSIKTGWFPHTLNSRIYPVVVK